MAPSSFEAILRRILALVNAGSVRDPSEQLCAEAEAQNLLRGVLCAFHLGAEWACEPLSTNSTKSHQFEVVRAASDWLDAHPEARLTPAAFARKFGYSPKYFARLFKKFHGMSPAHALINQRIRYAISLMRNRERNLSQIAEILGYDDVAYFSKQFKMVTGSSPRDFRQQL